MQDGRLHSHAASFESGADGYDAHRPTYPMDAVAWILGNATEVADVGAGTGKLTGALLELGVSVVAVDPSADMLRVLTERFPAVQTLEGAGESIPLPDSSVDLVTFAQAWHWVDADAATAEVLRVLRPDGRLALIWNSRDESVQWVSDLSHAMHQGLHAAGAFEPTLGPGLELADQRIDRWVAETSRAGIRDLATTRSYYLVAGESERAAMLERITVVLDAHQETRNDPIQLPYITATWIAVATGHGTAHA